jgi:hypothetical protein
LVSNSIQTLVGQQGNDTHSVSSAAPYALLIDQRPDPQM